MENNDVVPKQFIIKLNLTEKTKSIVGVLTCPDIFHRCHIRTRTIATVLLSHGSCILIEKTSLNPVFGKFQRSLKTNFHFTVSHNVYIRTKLEFTANPAVCPLSDYVTEIVSRQWRRPQRWLISWIRPIFLDISLGDLKWQCTTKKKKKEVIEATKCLGWSVISSLVQVFSFNHVATTKKESLKMASYQNG